MPTFKGNVWDLGRISGPVHYGSWVLNIILSSPKAVCAVFERFCNGRKALSADRFASCVRLMGYAEHTMILDLFCSLACRAADCSSSSLLATGRRDDVTDNGRSSKPNVTRDWRYLRARAFCRLCVRGAELPGRQPRRGRRRRHLQLGAIVQRHPKRDRVLTPRSLTSGAGPIGSSIERTGRA